jgi:putative ABC transport system permease protein
MERVTEDAGRGRNKTMRLATLTIKNVLRRPGRSALTVCGLAAAIGTVVALVGIVRTYEQSVRDFYASQGIDLVVFRKAGIYRPYSSLKQSLQAEIERMPEVQLVAGSITETLSMPDYGLYGVVLEGIEVGRFDMSRAKVVSGRLLREGDGRVVVLGSILAKNLNKRPGDTLELVRGAEPFTVVGVYESHQFVENNMILAPLSQIQPLLGREGEVTGFVITVKQKDEAATERLRQRIRGLSSEVDAQATGEFFDTAVETRLAMAMTWLTSTVALIVGSIGMLNTMLMTVVERTREIAILRAIGWRKGSVIRVILLESLILAVSGCVAGTLLAIGLTQVLTRLPAVQHIVTGRIAPSVIVTAVVTALLVCILGGVYPAWRAAGLLPSQALRQE